MSYHRNNARRLRRRTAWIQGWRDAWTGERWETFDYAWDHPASREVFRWRDGFLAGEQARRALHAKLKAKKGTVPHG